MKIVLTCFILMLLFAAPAMAQDSTPEATPDAPVVTDTEPFPEVPTVDVLSASLLTLIIAAVGGYVSSPITVTLVSLLKRIPGIDQIKGDVLQYAVAGLLVTIILVARQLGYADQLRGTLDFIQQAIVLIVGFTGAIKSSDAVYASAVKNEWAVLGYKRS